MVPGEDNTVVTHIRTKDDALLELPANFIIDATGLEADVREHRLLSDVLDHCGADTNTVGRLAVSESFEVTGTQNGDGRMYACGSATLGSYYTPVDSFLGLQYACLQISEDLAAQGFGHRTSGLRSVRQWGKWMRNKTI